MFKIESKKKILNVYAKDKETALELASLYAKRKNVICEYIGRKGKANKNKWTLKYPDVDIMEKMEYSIVRGSLD